MLSQATLPVSMTTDCGHFLRRGLNTDFHPGLVLLNAEVLSKKHFRHTTNDCVKRRHRSAYPWRLEKWIFTQCWHKDRKFYFTSTFIQSSLVVQWRHWKERLHSQYVFAPADKTANNVIIIWKKVLKGGGAEFYEYICTCSADERQTSSASYRYYHENKCQNW